jgi:hypothetical protein
MKKIPEPMFRQEPEQSAPDAEKALQVQQLK